jgi:hypothetical protein
MRGLQCSKFFEWVFRVIDANNNLPDTQVLWLACTGLFTTVLLPRYLLTLGFAERTTLFSTITAPSRKKFGVSRKLGCPFTCTSQSMGQLGQYCICNHASKPTVSLRGWSLYKETKHFDCTERVFESSKFSAHSSSAEILSHFCHWLASSNGKNPSGFQRG